MTWFQCWSNELVLFDHCNDTGSIDVKMNGSIFEEKSSFMMLWLTFSSKLDWGSYILAAETASNKIGALTHSMKVLPPEVTQ